MTLRYVAAISLTWALFITPSRDAIGSDLTQLSAKGGLIAATPFSFSKSSVDYVAAVSEGTSKDGLPVRRIDFYLEGQTDPKFEYETADGFLGFWPTNGEWSGTLWSTGSAMTFRAFGPTTSGVGLLLEKGLQMRPEVIDLDGDGKDELILTTGRFLVSGGKTMESPSSCSIYKWSVREHRFEQMRVVPWNTRQNIFGKLIK